MGIFSFAEDINVRECSSQPRWNPYDNPSRACTCQHLFLTYIISIFCVSLIHQARSRPTHVQRTTQNVGRIFHHCIPKPMVVDSSYRSLLLMPLNPPSDTSGRVVHDRRNQQHLPPTLWRSLRDPDNSHEFRRRRVYYHCSRRRYHGGGYRRRFHYHDYRRRYDKHVRVLRVLWGPKRSRPVWTFLAQLSGDDYWGMPEYPVSYLSPRARPRIRVAGEDVALVLRSRAFLCAIHNYAHSFLPRQPITASPTYGQHYRREDVDETGCIV